MILHLERDLSIVEPRLVVEERLGNSGWKVPRRNAGLALMDWTSISALAPAAPLLWPDPPCPACMRSYLCRSSDYGSHYVHRGNWGLAYRSRINLLHYFLKHDHSVDAASIEVSNDGQLWHQSYAVILWTATAARSSSRRIRSNGPLTLPAIISIGPLRRSSLNMSKRLLWGIAFLAVWWFIPRSHGLWASYV